MKVPTKIETQGRVRGRIESFQSYRKDFLMGSCLRIDLFLVLRLFQREKKSFVIRIN